MAALGTAADRRSDAASPGGETRARTPDRQRPTAAEMVDELEAIAAMMPTGSQPALDDDPGVLHRRRSDGQGGPRRAARPRHRGAPAHDPPPGAAGGAARDPGAGGLADRCRRRQASRPFRRSAGHRRPALRPRRPARCCTCRRCVDFDPQGDGQENPTEVHNAYDNNSGRRGRPRSTASASGAAIKSGVGLKVDLGKPVAVSQVRLLFEQAGVHVELRYSTVDGTSLDAYTVAATSGSNPGLSQVLTPRAGRVPVLAGLAH